MIGFRKVALIGVALLATACSASETRIPARIVMSGPVDAVTAHGVAEANATHGQLRITAGAIKGTAEATLTLPARTPSHKAFRAMIHCIDAKLSCALHGESVTRVVRASLG
ncbi:hypothetical protein [Caulobacter sp. RL271]|jgi:hypothetical protein|uniref:Lipoprotein n=1 Tax=Caulobacter segnis TaxID=88688 RepID=A0ABY4ZVC3_9CAUL|nr:hypothetical protein [Caulobacter segnis]USQ96757.1 hypothetical protein MZV50_04015 [Caulobacter segnis]